MTPGAALQLPVPTFLARFVHVPATRSELASTLNVMSVAPRLREKARPVGEPVKLGGFAKLGLVPKAYSSSVASPSPSVSAVSSLIPPRLACCHKLYGVGAMLPQAG